MSKSESCDPKYILQNLEATKEKSNKLTYITETFERCAITTTATTKKKRGMSGYNCYTKVQYEAEKRIAKQENREPLSFIQKQKTKGWSQESDKSKAHYNHMAEEGCPPRLWQ